MIELMAEITAALSRVTVTSQLLCNPGKILHLGTPPDRGARLRHFAALQY
jgi:hypothetical protein